MAPSPSLQSVPRVWLCELLGAPSLHLGHPAGELLGQIPAREVDVLLGHRDVAVPGEARDLVQVPARTGQIAQTEMA